MNTKGLVYSRIERDRLGKLLCRRCGSAAAAAAARFLASSSIPPRRNRNTNRGKKKLANKNGSEGLNAPKTEEIETPEAGKTDVSERRSSESENSEAESETVTMLEVEPDIHVEDLKSYKCAESKQNLLDDGPSPSVNTPVSCPDKPMPDVGGFGSSVDSDGCDARNGLLSYSSDEASLLEDSCGGKQEDENKDACGNNNESNPNNENDTSNAANDSPNDAIVRIYDNDPAIFAGEERLKVGVMRRESISVDTKYQCNYCAFACSSAVGLKMHVRVGHKPVLVYDTLKHLQNRNPMPYGMQYASMAAHSLENVGSKLRMGVRLQNVASDLASLNEKPFVCLFCDCSYKLQSSLLSHFRDQHSPYKPFQCSLCSQSFRRNIELVRHNIYRCPARAKNAKKSRKW
ncbi:hypothetical protein HAZT_HAZT008063 [Hyalella azteca]|nr:hypothetical protein HAZT_HAZT008063 [Hyalella azteca]